MLARTIALVSFSVTAAVFGLGGGCGNDEAPNPFGTGGSGGDAHDASVKDAGPDADPSLGGPCVDNAQCDDGIDCTFDRCDKTIGRCRFTPDDSQCQDKVYCNGVERCDNLLGCVPGVPVTCSDATPCTVDSCDEVGHGCKHVPRDVDGDGDPDIHCGGGDCDDTDPTVSSKKKEICGNGKDDDCDGKVDEKPCVTPAHDTCLDPLVAKRPGSYALTTSGAALDYPTSCGLDLQTSPNASDVVVALELDAGPPVDVEISATVAFGKVSVAIAGQCGMPATEIACGAPYVGQSGTGVTRIRARALGSTSAATAFPVYVSSDQPQDITVKIAFFDPEPKATNETCAAALPIVAGVPEVVEIVDAVADVTSVCAPPMGDLFYAFTLAAPADVDLYATSVDGTGLPMIGLRGAGCATAADEIACSEAAAAHVFRHALPAGDYFVEVSADAPTFVDVELDTSPPTAPPSDETCSGSPPIAPDTDLDVDLGLHQHDVPSSCLTGGIDAAYTLDLAEASDVLLTLQSSSGDVAAIALDTPACSGSSELACGAGASYEVVRASRRNVPAGSYRVVVASTNGEPVRATAFVRPAVPPTRVLFADTCAEAFAIPATGGFFQGNTANASADYAAGCDQSGGPPHGAPEQMLKLVLTETRRVVLDMTGSAYATLLDVRKGSSCPGAEVPLGCTVAYAGATSFLDLTLDAGTYWLQVDGYAGDSGAWFLDVRVVDP